MNSNSITAMLRAAAFGACLLCPALASMEAPKAIQQQAPRYSFELKRTGIEGAVLVSYRVNASGQVSNPVILSSTDYVFEEPTLAAISKWKFEPAKKDGMAVGVNVVQLVTFTLPDENEPTNIATLISCLQHKPQLRAMAKNNTGINSAVRKITGVGLYVIE